jgi:hypothetical protein
VFDGGRLSSVVSQCWFARTAETYPPDCVVAPQAVLRGSGFLRAPFQISKRAAGEATKFSRSGVELLGLISAAHLECGEPPAETSEFIRRQLGNSFDDFFDLHVAQYSIERLVERRKTIGHHQSGSAQRSPEPSLQFRRESMASNHCNPDRQPSELNEPKRERHIFRQHRPQAVIPSRWPRSPSPDNVPGDLRTFCVASKIATTRSNISVPPGKSRLKGWDRLASSTRYCFASTTGRHDAPFQHPRRENTS